MNVGVSVGHALYAQAAMRGSLNPVKKTTGEAAQAEQNTDNKGKYDVVDIQRPSREEMRAAGRKVGTFENNTPIPLPENVERTKGITITDTSNLAFYQQRSKDLDELSESQLLWYKEAAQKGLNFFESLAYQQRKYNDFLYSHKTLEFMWPK